MKTYKNQKEAKDSFADTLQVRQISPKIEPTKMIPPKKNIETSGNKYSIPGKLRNFERPKQGFRLDKTGLQCFMPAAIKTNKSDDSNMIRIPRQLKKAPLLSDIKMISMNIPRFGRGQAVIKSNLDNVRKSSKSCLSQFSSFPEQFQNEVSYEPTDLLQEAQREIDISQNQLTHLQSILKNKQASENIYTQPKWKIPSSKALEQGKENSKKRVLSTLTALNKKLSDMQEKYFNEKTSVHIPLKLQSVSEIEIAESDSGLDTQIQDKSIILDKFLPQFDNIPHKPNYSNEQFITTGDRNTFEVTRGKGNLNIRTLTEKTLLNELESMYKTLQDPAKTKLGNQVPSKPTLLTSEGRNEILQKFNLTKIKKKRNDQPCEDQLSIYEDSLTNKQCDKGQTFSDDIPDILIREPSQTSVEGMFESFKDASEIHMIKESGMEVNESHSDANTSKFSKAMNEKVQEMFLEHDKLTWSKMSNECAPQEYGSVAKNRETQPVAAVKPTQKSLKLSQVKSQVSDTMYYDCNSKVQTQKDFPNSPSTSKKKIFYDNFGRYSNISDKKYQRWNTEVNSAPNLPGKKSASSDTKTDKTIFDNTSIQDSIIKSDFLTKTFTIDASGNVTDTNKPCISTNKSDQFFNGMLDMKNVEGKNIKNLRSTKDMYAALTKALSNSFYKLPPQN